MQPAFVAAVPRTEVLETNLANVMIAELASHQPPAPRAGDSDDRYLLVEILREAAFDGTTTRTWVQPRYSAPYERVEIGVDIAPVQQARRRPATIARGTTPPPVVDDVAFDPVACAAETRQIPRFTSPYERIEIEEDSSRPSLSMHAAWFEAEVVDEDVEVARRPWLLIASITCALAVALVVVALAL